VWMRRLALVEARMAIEYHHRVPLEGWKCAQNGRPPAKNAGGCGQ
jgi:hypothetical protein